MLLGFGAGATGSVTVESGNWNAYTIFCGFAGMGSISIAGGTLSTSILNIAGQDIIVFPISGTPNARGTITLTGGVLNADIVNVGGPQGGAYNQLGGTANIRVVFDIGLNGHGTFSLSGGQMTANILNVFPTSGTSSSASLTGGRLSINTITGQPGAILYINGGTLQALSDRQNFISGFSGNGITIGTSGVVIDNNGFQIRIKSPITGPGGLISTGIGRLILSTDNTYTGDTIISAGVLRLGNGEGTGSVAGNIINNGTLEINRSGILNFSKTISGPGGVLIDSPNGIVSFNTDQPYTGPTTINAGQLSVNALLASPNVSIQASGTLNGSGTLAGSVVNFGVVNGIGAILGNVTNSGIFRAVGTFAGNLVNSGTISSVTTINGNVVNSSCYSVLRDVGTIAGNVANSGTMIDITSILGNVTNLGCCSVLSQVGSIGGSLANAGIVSGVGEVTGNVVNSGIVSGVGEVMGNVVNSGVLSPGASPGTMIIDGDYTQTNTGVLLIELASADSFDQLIVGGTANLDGSLIVEFVDGFMPECGAEFTILTAQHGVNGRFSSVLSSNNDILTFLTYDPSGAVTLFVPTSDALVGAVAVGNLPAAVLGEDALRQLSPRIVGTVKDIAFNVTNTEYGQITERLAAIRAGIGGIALRGLNQDPMVEQRRTREAKLGKTPVYYAPEVSPWSIFASAAGVFSNINSINDLPRFNSAAGYFNVGADCQMGPYAHVGIYGGYQGIRSWYRDGSAMRANGVKFGLYGTAQWNGFTEWDNFYINAIAGGGVNFYNLNRSLDIGKCGQNFQAAARGNPFGGELDSLLGGGYEFNLGNWRFGANTSIQYTYLGISSFTEKGAGIANARVDNQNPNSLVYTLGGSIAYIWDPVPGFRILPTIGLSWQHEFLNYGQRINAVLAEGSGINVPFYSATGSRNYAFGTAGVAAQLGRRISAYAYYNPQFGGGQIVSHGALMALSYNF